MVFYLYPSDHMFVYGRESVIPREKQTIASRKVMLTILLSGTSLISLDALPHDQTYTQEYFIQNVLSDLVNEKMRIWLRDLAGRFFIHMDNSMCHRSDDYPKNLRCKAWTTSPSSLFSRFESVRLLALWNVEGKHEELSIPDGWKNSGGRYIDLEWNDIRTAPVRLPQLDVTFWVGHFERGW
jgi:hypothetical protein